MSGLLRAVELERGARRGLPAAWVRWGCACGVAAVAGVGVLLVSRRLAGAITGDLSLPHLILTAVVVSVVVMGSRLVWRSSALSRKRQDERLEAVFGWCGSVALVLVAVGCSWGRSWDWLVWLPLIGVEQWQLRWFLNNRESRAESREPDELPGSRLYALDSRPLSIPPLIAAQKTTALRSGDFGSPVLGCSHPFEGGGLVLQRVVRVREEDGAESIQATLLAEFAVGQRQATLHVAFCPPLASLPVIEMEVIDGPEAELKIGVAYCHGARVEVRLGEPAEEECVVVVELAGRQQEEEEMGRG